MKRFCAPLLLTLFLLFKPVLAGDIIPDGLGHYGVVLDVLFTYEPEDGNVERWKNVFEIASKEIYRASSGEVHIKKVNLIICPLDVEGGSSTSTADVVIRRANGTSSAKGTLSGSRAGGVTFFDNGRSVEVDGGTMGHELAHYLFEIYDEYKIPKKLNELQIVYPANQLLPSGENFQSFFNNLATEGVISVFDYKDDEEDRLVDYVDNNGLSEFVDGDLNRADRITRLNFRQFCTHPIDVGQIDNRACIMDAGISVGNGTARDDYYGLLCNSLNHCSGVATINRVNNTVIWSKNGQSYIANKSCASLAKEVWLKHYTIFLRLPGTLAAGTPPEIEFQEKTVCSGTVVLLLDKSGSMQGARIARLKAAAMGLVDSLDDDTKLGIVWFDSQPQAAVGIQKLKDSRNLAKQAIAPIQASGGTRIGFGLGVAYQQLVLLRDPDEDRGEEVIFLITDGESQDDPTSAVDTIRADGVKIESVSIGEDADVSFLQEIARLTGGAFYFSPNSEDIARIVTQGATERLEGYTLVEEESVESLGTEITVNVDGFMGNVLLQVELNDFNTVSIDDSSFGIFGPNGERANAAIRFTALDSATALVTFDLEKPIPGEYKVRLPQASVQSSSSGRTLLLSQSNEMKLSASTMPADRVEYPTPVVITASVEGNPGSAYDVPVVAKIRRPDGSEIVFDLRDDGNRNSGDDISEDDVASGRFTQFNGNGVYTVEIIADNSNDQAVVGGGMHLPPTDQKFGAFLRRRVLSFEVTNYTAPQQNTLTLSQSSVPLPSQVFSSELSPKGALTLGSFHATTGPGQGVTVEEIDLSLASELVDLAKFEEFQIYVDSDKDGMIDFVGEHSLPLARVKGAVREGKVKLKNVFTLPENSDFDLLLVGLFVADVSVDQGSPEPINAGLPLAALALSGILAFVSRRRWTIRLASVLALASLVTLGCGDGRDSFVFDTVAGPRPSTATFVTQTGQVTSQIGLDSIRAVGEIDGQSVAVNLPPGLVITGPSIVVRTQIPQNN